MRLFAEENMSGTIELLLTRPVKDWQVIAGKFLGTLLLIAISLAMTLPYYFTVSSIGTDSSKRVLSSWTSASYSVVSSW